jgi:L-fuconolactonase
MIIDSHHHFWRMGAEPQRWRAADHDRIARDFGPPDLARELEAAGVDATVLVQSADSSEENDRLLEHARTVSFIAGVVAWLPLGDPALAQRELDRIAGRPEVRGVRCLIGRDRADWLVADETVDLLRRVAGHGLSWDVVPVTETQVRHVRTVAERVPELRVVVDHLGRPPLETGGWEPWSGWLESLAGHPNIALKVSVGIDVLAAWPLWDRAVLGRYVRRAVDCFGPRRLMAASNWPVVELRRGYRDAWTDIRTLLADTGLSEDDMRAASGGTADRWYRLTPADSA